MFSTTIGVGAGLYVFKPTAAPRLASQGASIPSAAVAVMDRGPVGRPFRVTGKTVTAICGKPLSMRKGKVAEGLRHVDDALVGSEYVSLVRVVPSDARFPVLSLMSDANGGSDEVVVVSNETYGTDVVMPANSWLTIWPVNGDPSDTVDITATVTDAAKGLFTIKIGEGSAFPASVNEEDVDDRGQSLYLTTVLEDGGYEYECLVSDTADLTKVGILTGTFTGGTNGTNSTLVANDYVNAWALLESADLSWRAGFAAGIYDATVLAAAALACEKRMAEFRYDVDPALTEQAAVAWMKTDGPKSYLARAYHYPYRANDEFYGGKSTWGISGTQTANKAKCVALPTNHAAVSGWMFVPAGESRGAIGRGGVTPLHVTDKASAKELMDARLNLTFEGIYANDCLSTAAEENDLKLEQVGAVLSAMAIDFASAVESIRFSPDGATEEGLITLSDELTERYYDSGSLVDPETLEVPYVIEITQPESDYWHIAITLKVTGVARRIGIQFKQAK
jgi:hypothetical protein